MSNFSKLTLARVGRLLNKDAKPEAEKATTDLAKLAEWTGVGRKALYNWTLPPDHAQFRAMSASAKRLIAVLAYFGIVGQLNEQRLKDIEALEAAMADEVQFNKIARRVSLILKAHAPAEAGKPAGEEVAAVDEEPGQEAA